MQGGRSPTTVLLNACHDCLPISTPVCVLRTLTLRSMYLLVFRWPILSGICGEVDILTHPATFSYRKHWSCDVLVSFDTARSMLYPSMLTDRYLSFRNGSAGPPSGTSSSTISESDRQRDAIPVMNCESRSSLPPWTRACQCMNCRGADGIQRVRVRGYHETTPKTSQRVVDHATIRNLVC